MILIYFTSRISSVPAQISINVINLLSIFHKYFTLQTILYYYYTYTCHCALYVIFNYVYLPI